MSIKSLALLGIGSRHWNINATLAALSLSEPYAIQVFDDYPGGFGDPRKNLNKLCARRNIAAVEVQLVYSKSHALIGIPYLKSRLPIWKKWQANHPGIALYISHTTEHYCKDKAKLMERMKLINSSGFIPVNNPEPGEGAVLVGLVNETHKPRRMGKDYIASMDGFDTLGKGDTLNWVTKHKGAILDFAWSPLCNLNDGKQGNKPCSQRTAAPSQKHLEMLLHISECPVAAPIPTAFHAMPLKRPWLWKPVRETTGDTRDNKPCLIAPIKVDRFEICTFEGDPIGELPYYDTYLKQGWRYYSGVPGGINLWGYEIAERAKQVSGSPWVFLRAAGKYYGPVEPAFRFGYFR